jgi:hypothetical protein
MRTRQAIVTREGRVGFRIASAMRDRGLRILGSLQRLPFTQIFTRSVFQRAGCAPPLFVIVMDPVGKHPLLSSPLPRRENETLSQDDHHYQLRIHSFKSKPFTRSPYFVLSNGRIYSCSFSTFRIFLLTSSLCPPLPLFGAESWTPHLPLDDTLAATAGYNP